MLESYATSLLDCSLVALGEIDRLPCRSYIAPTSTPVLDDCCECGTGRSGQLTVSIGGALAMQPFLGQPCGRQFNITLRVGLTRCVHTVTDSGEPPTSAQMQSDALGMFLDREALFKAITCCWAELHDFDVTQWSLTKWDIEQASGGCSYQVVEVQVRDALCSDCS